MEKEAEYTTPSNGKYIRFQRNWNNKLSCNYFTTIRLPRENYKVDNTLKLMLHENGIYRDMGYVRIIEVKPIRPYQINDWMAFLDAGMSADKLREMFYFMYKDKVDDFEKTELVYMILEKVKNAEKQQQLF